MSTNIISFLWYSYHKRATYFLQPKTNEYKEICYKKKTLALSNTENESDFMIKKKFWEGRAVPSPKKAYVPSG